MKFLCLLALVQTVAFGDERKATAADIVELVFNSVYSDHDDAGLAQQLDKVKMVEQLSPPVVSYFEYLKVGPLALQALRNLQEKTALLPPPAGLPVAIQPVPSPAEQIAISQRLIQYAQSYVHNLPNFLCDQVTQRYTNLKRIEPDGTPYYVRRLHHTDKFTRSLRFISGAEDVKRIADKTGESTSNGEFGGDMVIIFGLGVNPHLNWDHWEMFRGSRRAVFNYSVNLPQSRFILFYCCSLAADGNQIQQQCMTPIRGFVYVDTQTGVISRLTIQAVDLPSDFHIKESNTIIDYKKVNIGSQAYELPVSAVMFMRADNQKNRNEISFIKYRKFEAESVFTYTESKIRYKSSQKKIAVQS